MVSLRELLEEMTKKKASDLHITPGVPPQLRVDGAILATGHPALSPEDASRLAYSILTEEQKKRLLQIARTTMETYIKTGKRLDFKEDDPTLNREMGAFVTIHKHGQLRGCIGNIIGSGPLYLTVRNMAIESSTGDPRFAPVTEAELKDIDIETKTEKQLSDNQIDTILPC